jgi:hypothetical protein
MRERGHVLRVAGIIGLLIASTSVATADDPYGCKAKIRSELGIAPYTGQYYPGFWDKVRRCISSTQGGGGAVRSASRPTEEESAARNSEKSRSREKLAHLPKPERPSTEALHSRKDSHEKPQEAHVVAVRPQATPVQTLNLARPATVGEFGRRVALVIGNGKYQYAPVLPNPTNDAEALAKALEQAGFQSVTLRENLTRDQLLAALAEFARVADAADWAAVYYSGHGIESRGVNYIIPVDAQLKVDRDVDLETVDIGKVLSSIEGARKLRLVILDACRDNPFLNQMKRTVATRTITRGLVPVEPDPGILIVYSAKHGETALDGDGTNSPFATALINRILTPNLELRRLFDLVRDDVLATTGHQQQPFSYGSLSGSEDFFFETK